VLQKITNSVAVAEKSRDVLCYLGLQVTQKQSELEYSVKHSSLCIQVLTSILQPIIHGAESQTICRTVPSHEFLTEETITPTESAPLVKWHSDCKCRRRLRHLCLFSCFTLYAWLTTTYWHLVITFFLCLPYSFYL